MEHTSTPGRPQNTCDKLKNKNKKHAKYVLRSQWNKARNNNRKRAGKSSTVWKLSDIFLNKSWVKNEVSRDTQNILNSMKMETQFIKILGVQFLEENL